jgi:hypothetical protein
MKAIHASQEARDTEENRAFAKVLSALSSRAFHLRGSNLRK